MHAAVDRPAPAARHPDVSRDSVRAFLIDSERRVLAHCRKLLLAPGLPDDDRHRLERLSDEAEAELRRLAA